MVSAVAPAAQENRTLHQDLPKVVAPRSSETSMDEPKAGVSSTDVIAALKNALARPNNRQVYKTLSRLVDSMDAGNVREVLSYAQRLPKEQDKAGLLSLIFIRWGELNPTEAVASRRASRPARTPTRGERRGQWVGR